MLKDKGMPVSDVVQTSAGKPRVVSLRESFGSRQPFEMHVMFQRISTDIQVLIMNPEAQTPIGLVYPPPRLQRYDLGSANSEAISDAYVRLLNPDAYLRWVILMNTQRRCGTNRPLSDWLWIQVAVGPGWDDSGKLKLQLSYLSQLETKPGWQPLATIPRGDGLRLSQLSAARKDPALTQYFQMCQRWGWRPLLNRVLDEPLEYSQQPHSPALWHF